MNNIYIDVACLGKFILIDVSPDYYGADNERHKKAQGYKYEVLMPAQKHDKIVVKIPGEQQLEAPLSGTEPTVEFADLKVKPYVDSKTGRMAFSATASSVKIVGVGAGAGKTQAKG